MSEAKIVLTAVDNTSRAFASARQGLSGLGSAAATVKTALTGIGVVAAASYLSTMVEETKRAIDSFKDLSDATGASVENVSALDRVARATGGTFDQVSGILVKFNQMLNEADPKKGAGAVLKSLNLDIAELKKLDPAEALRRTAVALQGFADDGVKARAVQELFGKSVREAAPFLKDLAESGKLVGTVSDRAADEVDRFNKQLSLIKANATDVERALTIDIITSVNELIERYKVGQREGKAFWEIAWQGYKQDVRSFWGMSQEDPRADIRREIADAERDLEALRARKSRPFNFAADLDKEISAAEKKVVDAQRRLYASGLSGGRNAGGGRGFVNPDLVRPQLIVKEEGKEPKKPKEKADFVGPIYDDPIALKVDRLFEDGDVSNARVYAATVERLDDLFFSGAIGVELYDAAMKELNGSTSAGADQTSKFTKEQMRLAELLGNTESAGIQGAGRGAHQQRAVYRKREGASQLGEPGAQVGQGLCGGVRPDVLQRNGRRHREGWFVPGCAQRCRRGSGAHCHSQERHRAVGRCDLESRLGKPLCQCQRKRVFQRAWPQRLQQHDREPADDFPIRQRHRPDG